MSQYTIPTVVERTPAGERAFDIYSRLLSERIVFLGTEIDDGVANVIMAQLLHLEAASPDLEISLYINSPGGSYSALTAIYDTMQYIRPDVATICMGQASSAAAVLLAAGAAGRRAVLQHAKVLLHQPSSQAQGALPDLAVQAKEVARTRREVEEILAGTPAIRWTRSGATPTATRPSAPARPSHTASPTRSSPPARPTGRPSGRHGQAAALRRPAGSGPHPGCATACGRRHPPARVQPDDRARAGPVDGQIMGHPGQQFGQVDPQRIADGGQDF